MIRLLFLLHRYLGIAVGMLMAMWCVTGVVMMYVSYPSMQESERLHDLAVIDWTGCCKISEQALDGGTWVSGFQLEMLDGRPMLDLRTETARRLVDLTTGTAIARISPEQAAAVVRTMGGIGQSSSAHLDEIDHDQWTVSGDFNADRPLYRFYLGNASGTEIYVSSATGRVVQLTTRRQRFWNWLGAVPHWLYFTELRHRAFLWSQIVIVASSIGCFLAVTGLYLGTRQFLRRPSGRFSPYEGFNLWHHVAGLVFGIFTLTWILSGLLSMNPWGWLEGAGAAHERTLLGGMPRIYAADVKAALEALAKAHPLSVVSIKTAPLNGRLYFIANAADGRRQRLGVDGMDADLKEGDWAYVSGILDENGGAGHPQLLYREDDYYFSHHSDRVLLPVYRLVLRDGAATRYYIDPVSGELLAKIDAGAREYRWLHQGLHRMDFVAALRSRPRWDVLMLSLMSGVTMICLTGTYLGFRRLVLDKHA